MEKINFKCIGGNKEICRSDRIKTSKKEKGEKKERDINYSDRA